MNGWEDGWMRGAKKKKSDDSGLRNFASSCLISYIVVVSTESRCK